MSEKPYMILSADVCGIHVEKYSELKIRVLLGWDEEAENIGMEAENGCTEFTSDPDCIDDNTCMIIKGKIILPDIVDHIVTQTVKEYKL